MCIMHELYTSCNLAKKSEFVWLNCFLSILLQMKKRNVLILAYKLGAICQRAI